MVGRNCLVSAGKATEPEERYIKVHQEEEELTEGTWRWHIWDKAQVGGQALHRGWDYGRQRTRVAKCNFLHGENILNFTGAEVAMGGSELGIK